MAIVYKVCGADGSIPEYLCDLCGEPEMGGLRGAAYIHKSLKAAITSANVQDIDWWSGNIQNGKIFIIPSTRGTYDGGAKNTVTGFGDEQETVTGKTFTAVVNDRHHAQKQSFYESLEANAKDYIFGFRTGSELRIAKNVIQSVEAKDNVEEGIDTNVLWNATVIWKQNKPYTTVPVYPLADEVKDLFSNCIEEITAA
jgi:hypothetical protein